MQEFFVRLVAMTIMAGMRQWKWLSEFGCRELPPMTSGATW